MARGYEDAEIVEVLRDAQQAVTDAQIEAEFRIEAFKAAVQMRSTKTIQAPTAIPVDLSHMRRGQ